MPVPVPVPVSVPVPVRVRVCLCVCVRVGVVGYLCVFVLNSGKKRGRITWRSTARQTATFQRPPLSLSLPEKPSEQMEEGKREGKRERERGRETSGGQTEEDVPHRQKIRRGGVLS